jgi:5-methyltetrahydrofolate--homocysteine methyltransferase
MEKNAELQNSHVKKDKSNFNTLDLTLVQRLDAGEIIVADGATGTMLISAGLPQDIAPEQWNIDRPEEIIKLHKSYITAGSQIILTNTFGGSRLRLDRHQLGNKVQEFNKAGAELAKLAAGNDAYVAGDIGPTSEMMEPFGTLTFDLAVEVFAEQAAALAAGGVDAIWVETMTDLEEIKAAVTGIKQVTSLPVLCSMSFGKTGFTMMGVSPIQAAETLAPLGITALGINCGEGLEILDSIFEQIKSVDPKLALIAKPNAGLPQIIDGTLKYDITPEQFAGWIKHFVEGGVQIVGGCCGSNTEFIKTIKETLKPV